MMDGFKRLLLRPPRAEDVERHFAIHGDPATNIHNPSGPVPDMGESAAMLNQWMAHWREHGFGFWAVAAAEAPDLVIGFGGTNLKPIAGTTRFNLYYRFAPAAWGKGYASELGEAALANAFDALSAPAVHAVVRPDNAPSIRVLERLGMERVGEVDDVPGRQPSMLFRKEQGADRGRTS